MMPKLPAWLLSYFLIPLGLILLSFLVVSQIYQIRLPNYQLELGERADRPYVSGFNEREPAEKNRTDEQKWDGISYRWSKANSRLLLAGVGSQTLTATLRYTASPNPNAVLTITINTAHPIVFPAPQDAGWVERAFRIEPNWFADGDLTLDLHTNSFSPVGDKRELGLAVDWLRIEAAEPIRLVNTPDYVWWKLALAVLSVYFIGCLAGLPLFATIVTSLVALCGLALWLIEARYNLTALLSQEVVRPLLFLILAALVITRYAPRIYRWLGIEVNPKVAGYLAILFVSQFALLYFGQLHPQFLSSDLGLNIHRLQGVQAGNWVFTEPLPNNQPAPYPPGLYFFLLPFTIFTGLDDAALGHLIVTTNIFLIASGVFLIYYVGTTLSNSTVGVLAATFYAFSRYQFYVFSQGNHANIFGAWTFLLFISVLVYTLENQPTLKIKPIILLITSSLLLVFLSHYGTFLFANAFVIACLIILVVLGKQGLQKAYLLGIGWLLALLLAFSLYYYNHIGLFGNQSFAKSSGNLDLIILARSFYTSHRINFGLPMLIAVIGGLGFYAVAWQRLKPAQAIVLALLGTNWAFALAEAVQGLETRYQLYIISGIAMVGSLFLARFWHNGWAGKVLIVGLLAAQGWSAILFWLERITYYFLG